MMKHLSYIFIFLLSSLMMACSEDDKVADLTIQASQVTFDADGGQGSIQVSKPGIEVKSDEDWCKVEADGNVVKVSVDANESIEGRSARVEISADGQSVHVPVTQKGNIFTCDDSELGQVLPYEGGSVTVHLKSVAPYEVIIPESAQGWLSYTKDTDNGTITFTATPDADKTPRGAEVTVKVGSKEIYYHIGSFEEQDIVGTYDVSYYDLDGEQHTGTTTIQSNGSIYVMAVPDAGLAAPLVYEDGTLKIPSHVKVASLRNGYSIYTTVLTTDYIRFQSGFSYDAYPSCSEDGKFAFAFGGFTPLTNEKTEGLYYYIFDGEPSNDTAVQGYFGLTDLVLTKQ